jgi:hypothetical protein
MTERTPPARPPWADRAVERDRETLQALHADPDWIARAIRPRFTETASGCWEWTGGKNQTGYGAVYLPHSRTKVAVPRLMFLATRGGIGYGLSVAHSCGVRACANPAHLVEVSRPRPIGEGSRTHCQRGHRLDPDNLIVGQLKRGNRSCKTCNRQHASIQGRMIGAAAACLGVTRKQYLAEHGGGRVAAEAVLSRFYENPAVVIAA